MTGKARICAIILLLLSLPGLAQAMGGASTDAPENPVPASGQVNIFRDVWGVPHVYAENESDGLFGVGYALADDNLEAILFRYVVLNARSAEIFGPDFVGADLFVRRYRILEESRTAYTDLNPEIQQSYIAYMAGMRKFMDENPSRVPAWWKDQIDLEPALATAFWQWLTLIMSVSNGLQECLAGGVSIDIELKDRGFASNEAFDALQSTFVASNQMLLMNSRTKDDVLFLVNDNHTTFEAQRAELRLHAGDLHVSGVTVAGYPLPGIGHTRNVAWAHTSGWPDTADCFSFEIDPEDPGKYLSDGRATDFSVDEIELAIKDQPSRTVFQKYVRKGGLSLPVLAERDGKVYAIATGEMGRAGAIDRTYALMNKAETVDDVIGALEHGNFPENVMAADTKGEAIYLRTGMAPRRPEGDFDWQNIVPGGTSATDWKGLHPLSDLVQTRNPTSGYMQNNNISPDNMIADDLLPDDLRPAGYPKYIFNSEGRINSRGQRAIELLGATTEATLDDFTNIVFDEKWISAKKWSAALSNAIAAAADWPARPEEARTVADRIVNFDGVANRGSIGALNFTIWLDEISSGAPEPRRILEAVLAGEPLASDDQAVLRDAIQSAVDKMKSHYGTTSLTYGDVYGIGRGDTWEPVGGGILSFGRLWREQTIRAIGFRKRSDKPERYNAARGQINPIIMTVRLNGSIESSSVVPFGQRNAPGFSHYSDQSKLFGGRETKPSFFEYEDLRDNIESTITISTH